MTHKKKLPLLTILATLFSNYSYADGSMTYLEQSGLSQEPLYCSNQDYAWYEKTGPDSVEIPLVESQSTYIQADSLNGQNKKLQIAQGNVIAYKDNQTLSSDWLFYNMPDSHATAGDRVIITRQYDSIQAKWVDYYLDLDKGTFTQARIHYNKENVTAVGQTITVQDKKHATIDQGYFTGCNPDDPAWYIKSQQMTFDYQNSEGTARNATMYFESLPVFASPYMTFPLGERKSGWLTPNFGGTSTAGFMASEAYYFNLAPNYDATITPEFWANQGFMVTGEYRYKTESNVGSVYTEQMPYSWGNDTSNTYRWYWSLNDTYNPWKDFTTGYTYNQVSDNNYFNDFGNFYSVTDNVNLEQSAYVKYAPQWGSASVKVQQFQTLYPFGYTQTIPIYASYPAAVVNVKPQDIGGGFQGGLNTQYTYFSSSSMQSGSRAIVYPSLTYPVKSSWGYITPKVGYSDTNYNLGTNPGYANSAGTYNVGVPITSVDSGLYFDRPISLGSGSYTQTFEPRLYYLYIPEVNQANLPIFDTATATYNYNQLFSENRFSGYDRINMANDVTLGVVSRVINDSNGSELMKLNVGYRYFITPENNFIYGNQTQYGQLFLPNPNFITELTNQWSKEISSTATFQYDTNYNVLDAWTAGLKYNPDVGKIINVGFSYQYQLPVFFYGWSPGQAYTPNMYENQYALNIAGQWPLYENKIYAVGQYNYDYTRQLILNMIGGLEYNGGCYTISAVYQQFNFNFNQTQQNYMLNFSFRGFGNVGTGDPTSQLRSNIPGYMPMTQIQEAQYQ